MACKRCEISTFIKDNGVDRFFVTETWLSAQGDEEKTAELAPSGSIINQSIKFISNQIKKFDIQCTLYNIHGKLFYNKHVATFSISD